MKRFLAWRSKKSSNLLEQEFTCSEKFAPILALPAELLDLIVSHLTYESSLAFSLTCKQLYDILFLPTQSSPTNDKKSSLQFLRLLEHDLPDYMLCPPRGRLYAWRKQKSNRYQCPNQCNETSIALCGPRCGVPSSRYMNDHIRCLMLRHALYGPQYGIQPSKFNHVCSTVSESHNQIDIKVVNQRLLIRRTLRVAMIMDHFGNLVKDTSCLSLCLHSSPGYYGLLRIAVAHVSAARRQHSTSNQWSCPLLLKCKQCATDARISITQGSRRTAAVEFDVYHDLGGLENVTEAQRQVLYGVPWLQSSSNGVETQRLREDLSKQFHSSDKQDLRSEGESDRMFLDQWNQTGTCVRWAFHFTGDAQAKSVWVQYSNLPLELVKA